MSDDKRFWAYSVVGIVFWIIFWLIVIALTSCVHRPALKPHLRRIEYSPIDHWQGNLMRDRYDYHVRSGRTPDDAAKRAYLEVTGIVMRVAKHKKYEKIVSFLRQNSDFNPWECNCPANWPNR